MRAIAVLLVVAAHALDIWGLRSGANVHPLSWHVGRTGVLIFFVHTSLVLMFSLARTRAEGAALFAHFYLRRGFRIYPLAFVAVAAALFLGSPADAWKTETVAFSAKQIVSNFLLIQNLNYSPLVLSPLWSLPIELQMYVVLPPLFWLVSLGDSPGQRVRIVGAGLLLSVLAGIGFVWLGSPMPLDLLRFSPCFFAGVLAYARGTQGKPQAAAFLWPVLLLALTGAYTFIARQQADAHPHWLGWIYCLAIALSIPHFRPVAEGWAKRAAHQIAKYSYGIYLFHMLGLWIAWGPTSPVTLSPLMAWLVFGSSLTIVPVLAYHAVEEPLIRVGGRAAARWLR